ncbi:MAG TPA: pantoate--beta-alanine ligase [Prolixibacteraceae bacterium]|nr:pantoate--beta-alanine ligase [Prolixibacteraceae bacterium]HPS12182.1 pantoate--beta-alanine ligase [Prolixibacteraceae bacterium]
MEVVKSVKELRKAIDIQRQSGLAIGFVPTMGALHEGHLSLVNRAGKETDFVVVSIFVNPTQFNNKEDLVRYPRTLEKDLLLLEKTACQLVFAPSVEEVYPEEDTRKFNFGSIENVMEGKFRPGHFNGVAQVVSKLFDMVRPDKAFFGLKDFQQVAIINKMVEMLKLDLEIVPCPIVRESSGLALSSRNALLSPVEKENACLISKTLFSAVEMAKNHSVDEVKQWVIGTIDKNPYLQTEYFEIVDFNELTPINNWDANVNKIGCIAVHCGKVRLIDNVIF